MKTRIIVSAIFVPILFVVLFFLPPVYLTAVVSLIAGCISFEFLRGTKAAAKKRMYIYAAAAAIIIPFGVFFAAGEEVFRAVLFLLVAVMFVEGIVAFGKEKKVELLNIMAVLFAGAVIPYMLSVLVGLKVLDNGKLYVLLPIIVAFLSDSGAYFAGMYLGKHKAFPHVSPNKTIEGCLGGLLCSVICMVIYGVILLLATDLKINFLYLIIYGIVGNIATQLGDLSYSLIKRQYGIKDYGNLIPGHGGMLDRFDSMTFAAPAIYILVNLIPAF